MDRIHKRLVLVPEMSDILAIVCKHKSISITDLTKALQQKGYRMITESEVERNLSRYPEVETWYDDEEMICKYSFNIELCMTPNCRLGQKCNKVQICEFFLNGRCDKGNSCKYPHDLSSPHNAVFLRKHNLDKVEANDIYSLIRKRNTDILCTHYNSERGCKRSNDCNFLHICRKYIEKKCQPDCQFNHSIYKTNCRRVLKARNIPVDNKPAKEIIDQLRHALGIDQRAAKPVPMTPSKEHDIPTTTLKGEICTYSIRGKCFYKERCIREHHLLPYKWFYKMNAGWYPFPKDQQTLLEEGYCDPSKIGIRITNRKSGEHMLCHFAEIRRISTPSSVTQPPSHLFTTEWIWYYEDNPIGCKRWTQYSTKKSINGNDVSSKGSKELEEDYQLFLEKPNLSTVMFNAGQYSYRLDFNLMQQENISTKTIRRVRRRPVKLVTIQDILRCKREIKLKRDKETGGNPHKKIGSLVFPDCWEKVKKFDPESSFQLVDVKSKTTEYEEIRCMFNYTCSHEVVKIQRVQNEELWEDYARKRERMMKKRGGSLEEKRLWHGTSEHHAHAICQQNFDFRCSGSSVGTVYGQGSYFARDAKYSACYAVKSYDGRRFMFLAKVLVGEYTVGNSSYRRPPEIANAGKIQDLYDSCVDSISNPTIFVIFDKDQMYPEYLVQY